MEPRIRVLIADDRPPSRNGLRALLASWSAVEHVYEAADGLEALQVVEELQPDVVLMDVHMPVMDGLEATRLLKRKWPAIKVIVLSISAMYRAKALTAGADGFLLKGCPTEDLLNAISWHGTSHRLPEERGKSIRFRPLCAGLAP
jgi:DNA-binding NarL/FixJ family response regulator